MQRQIIHIDEEKCTGCGACAAACHEGAIAMVNGKARLMRDDYCDGMGDCLPACPAGAITFTRREAAAYDAAAVAAHKQQAVPAPHACPGAQMRDLRPQQAPAPDVLSVPVSRLRNWPVQIKLAPVTAPYFAGADLLVAADCTAYAYAGLDGRITLIGCPKLDAVDYAEKLTAFFAQNDIRSVTVVRMEVPCCGGLEMAVKRALQAGGKSIPCQVVTVSVDGKILER